MIGSSGFLERALLSLRDFAVPALRRLQTLFLNDLFAALTESVDKLSRESFNDQR